MQKPTYDAAAYAGDMDIDEKSFLEEPIEISHSDWTGLSYKPDVSEIFTALDKQDKITLFTRLVDGNELSGIVDDLNCSKSTAYNYVRDLRSADLVKKKSQGTGFEVTRRGNLVFYFLRQLDSDLGNLEKEKSFRNLLGDDLENTEMDLDIWDEDSYMNELEVLAEASDTQYREDSKPPSIWDSDSDGSEDDGEVDKSELECS